jgi:hypothetical protein
MSLFCGIFSKTYLRGNLMKIAKTLLAAAAVSAFVMVSASAFAADAAKTEPAATEKPAVHHHHHHHKHMAAKSHKHMHMGMKCQKADAMGHCFSNYRGPQSAQNHRDWNGTPAAPDSHPHD